MLPEIYRVPVIRDPHPIAVHVPGSKSITNRALLIAALSDGISTLSGVLFSDDSRNFLQALIDLGFDVKIDEPHATVAITGCGGKIPKKEASIYVGSAGTAARFLTAFLGLSEGRFRIDASEQMKKRPMKELLDALVEMGAEITYEEETYHFPFVIGNPGWKTHEVTVDVEKSSQFLSALLIASVLSNEDFKIHVTGNHGMAYVDMTVAMMEQFGVTVQRGASGTSAMNGEASDTPTIAGDASRIFTIARDAAYRSRDYAIEPDLSGACYFYAMAPLLLVPAKVYGVRRDSLQGDIRFLNVLTSMGCTTREEEDGIVLLPPKGKLRGGKWDLSAFSDQALTLAAIAPFAEDTVIMQKIGHIRFQECDRMNAIVCNLTAMGIDCRIQEDSIVIHPGKPHGCQIETFEDHRVAMAFTVPGLVTEDVFIKNPACCRKTFENFYDIINEITT
jgi:3-phosphoshikimate 1-carboxyvinyltransferase